MPYFHWQIITFLFYHHYLHISFIKFNISTKAVYFKKNLSSSQAEIFLVHCQICQFVPSNWRIVEYKVSCIKTIVTSLKKTLQICIYKKQKHNTVYLFQCKTIFFSILLQRREYVKYAKVFPLTDTFDFKIPSKWYRRTVGFLEILSGMAMALIPSRKYIF